MGEVPQSLLLHRLGADGQPRVLGSRLRELSALLQVAWRFPASRMPVRVLFNRNVPHEASVRAMVLQHCLLSGGGEQPIPEHANTLVNITDIPGR
jgi:hypothetical protein